MAGICGVALAGRRQGAPVRIAAMLDALRHRGRGPHSILAATNACLGSTTDPVDTQSQVTRDASGRYLLALDAQNLRTTKTGPATAAVVMGMLITKGPEAVAELRGGFALIFWDSATGTVLLARDRIGIRPLVWTRRGAEVLIASEATALRAGGAPLHLSIPDLVDAGVLWGVHPGRTVFDGVRAVPPGTVVLVSEAGVQETAFWSWRFAEERDTSDLTEQAERLSGLVSTAVSRQLPADRPAVLISGGLDSAAVAGAAREIHDGVLRSYSASFTDPSLDESAFQALAVDALGTRHLPLICDAQAVATAMPDAVARAEMPLIRTAPASLFRFAEHIAADDTRIVLSGEGSDELFCGYDIFKVAATAESAEHGSPNADPGEPAKVLDEIVRRQQGLGRPVSRLYYEHGSADAADPLFSHLQRWSKSFHITRYLAPPLRSQLALDEILDGVRRRLPVEYESWHPVERAQFLEIAYFFPSGGLNSQCDRPYSAHGVNLRFPFLDDDVIDFSLTLPLSAKLAGDQEKVIVKRASARWVPPAITQRVKQPFTAPEGDVFRSDAGCELIATYLNRRSISEIGIFDADRVEWLTQKVRRGRTSFHDDLALVWILSVQVLATVFAPPRTQEVNV